MNTLIDLGWTEESETRFEIERESDQIPARVVREHRGGYRVHSASGELAAGISGRLRHEALVREDLPAVGDWVAITELPGESRAVIHGVLPRGAALVRREAGSAYGDAQVLAANLDAVFIVTSMNRDLNPRRIERLLTLSWESGAQPVILLSKADLCADVVAAQERIAPATRGAPVITLSALRGDGVAEVRTHLGRGRTAALIGTSGVGKSTLANALLGTEMLATGGIREDDQRGRHTTTNRQLVVVPDGGVLIDTPGLREIALWSGDAALPEVFDDLDTLAGDCRFSDCGHEHEPGCAVVNAIAAGTLDQSRLESWRKLQREMAFQRRRDDPREAAAASRRWRAITKSLRHHPKHRERG